MRPELPDESLIEAIYGSALFEDDWDPALQHFRRALKAMETSLCTAAFDSRGRLSGVLALTTTRHLHTPDSEVRTSRNFMHLDPKTAIFATRDVGYLLNDARHFDKEFIARDTFYQECVLPLGTRHTLDMQLHRRNARTTFLAAMRPGRSFDAQDEQLFARMSRHFQRVLELKGRVAEAQSLARQAVSALDRLSYGILIFNDAAQVVIANAFARSLLANGGELQLRQSRLCARSGDVTRRIDAMLCRAAGGVGPASVMRLPREHDGYVVLWCVPLPPSSPLACGERPGALVVLRSAGTNLELGAHDLETLYGLTKAEARLALALGHGQKLPAIAQRHGVSVATLRTQLHWVLQKTGLETQADLARTLASISRLLREERAP